MSRKSSHVAIVSGASSGIGKATAKLLRDRGLVTVGLSRRLPDGDTTARCDVRDEQAVACVFDRVLKRFGRIDVLVNCAGIASTGGALDMSVEEWESVFRTNVIGTYLCCRYAVPVMRQRRNGCIVNVASIAARSFSRTASVAYTSSKYAVVGLTRQLAAEFAGDGLRINCICPSQTLSEMLRRQLPTTRLKALAAAHPMGRLAQPLDVARVIGFLVSDDAAYVSGAVVDVNGGVA